MNRGRNEPCRNFTRGSCRYGDRCKFSHSINIQQQPQQQPPGNRNSNPFGFNAFAQHPKGASSAFPSAPQHQNQNQNQYKPFQNKWTRTPDTNNSTFAKQSSNQPQATAAAAAAAANHTCTDPETCKRLIAEDFQNEMPLWKLTCYGHFKHLPCDIVGDISYEELRAAAYDDAKKGMSLSSVVERERNLLNSKLIEFDNLLRNKYTISPNTVSNRPSPFPNINASASPASVQNNVPPAVSSFSQLGNLTNQGSNPRAVAPSNSIFGQPSPFQVSSETSAMQPNPFTVSSQTQPAFGTNNVTFGNQGLFGNQQRMQPQGSASTFNKPSGFGNNLTTSSTGPLQPSNAASNQSPIFFDWHNTADTFGAQTHVEKSREVDGDTSTWLKEKWNPGEIPEDAPPLQFCT